MTSTPLNPAASFAYSDRVRELFADLRHADSLSDVGATHASPSAASVNRSVVAVGSREQGATVTWSVQAKDTVIESVRYRAYGCPYFLAGCESLARWLEGKPVAALDDWNWRDIESEFQAPPSKRSRWLLLEDAVRQLAKKLA